jgi:catechol 2,3-dioxygenase-like lactoylglutathione lyase family enzyme
MNQTSAEMVRDQDAAKAPHVPQIERLAHVGIFVRDLETSIHFYRDILGLTMSDDDREHGLVFLSSHPDDEHHEVLLTTGRTVPIEAKLIQQISFRCPTLADVIAYWRRLVENNVKIMYTITHGNAIACYFFDPDDNICEVYWRTGLKARQGFLIGVDLNKPEEELLAFVRQAVAEHGKTGYVDMELLATQKIG